MRRILFLGSMVFFAMAAYIFVTDFIKPCDPGRGIGLTCDFSGGKIARIDSSARIEIANFDSFTIGYFNSAGVLEKQTPLSIYGFYTLGLTTSGPSEIMMLKSSGGISTPSIYVNPIDSGNYPSLKVTRTWNNPLLQLIQWYLFIPFLCSIISGAFLMYLPYHKFK